VGDRLQDGGDAIDRTTLPPLGVCHCQCRSQSPRIASSIVAHMPIIQRV
jgi:hypothetical protein